MRGADPPPVVPPVAATGRPAEKLTTDAPRSTATTAAATARSGPIRETKDRRLGSAGRLTVVRGWRCGTRRDAATTECRPRRTACPTAGLGNPVVRVLARRWCFGRRRRPRTRWNPTDAFSNTVSMALGGPLALGGAGLGGRERTVPRSRIRAGVSVRFRRPCLRAYDIERNPTTDVATRANRRCVERSGVETLRQRRQELGVRLRLGQAVEQDLDAFVGTDRREHPAHGPDHLERPLLEEQLLAPGAGTLDVDRR